MPKHISRRLVIENDERNYSAWDLLSISEEENLPMCVDFFHQACYEVMHPSEQKADWNEILSRTLAVWKKRGIVPKYHVSEQ